MTDPRSLSPGLEGVVAAETALGLVDGQNGRLLYRGYPIGELVERGTYAEVAELLWTGEWHPDAQPPPAPLPEAGPRRAPRQLPRTTPPDGRVAHRRLGLGRERTRSTWPPTVGAGARADRVLAVCAGRVRPAAARAWSRSSRIASLDLAGGFLHQLTGERPDPAAARALDAYFIVGAEHGFNASTFTARVITSTRSRHRVSAVVGAIGALKGPLHGGAPSEVVNQLHEIGSPERAERMDPRRGRARRADHGLRAPRLSRLRPARGGTA